MWESALPIKREGGTLVYHKIRINDKLYFWDAVNDRKVPCDPRTAVTQPWREDNLNDKLTLIHLNLRSLVNKTTDLESILISYNPQVRVITETWLHQCIHNDEILPPGIGIIHKGKDTRESGTAVLFKENLVVSEIEDIPGIESVWIKLFLSLMHLIFYRPFLCKPSFYEKVNNSLYRHNLSHLNLVLAKDFHTPAIDWYQQPLLPFL